MSEDRTRATPAPATAPAAAEGPAAPVSTQLRTVALCDLVESTALVERLGDRRAADLFRRHDRVARDLLYRHHGREIDKTDGFLALFDRPIHAVAFALDYQRALRGLGAEERVELSARVGIHVGDVLLWENAAEDVAKGAKPTEVEGLAKPLAARLMHLARPGQVLLSGMAHNLALRAQDELGAAAERLRWPTHGRYRFKGLPAPLLVHEVGEVGIAPLRAPPSSSKAQRELPLWRKPRALALEALVGLAAVLALVLALVGRPQPAIAFGERDWVVIGDLRNLTDDPDVAEALATAFRISLEQSRFVNVLPDLKLRDALARMQQPADAPVDRGIGSQIALREGARALILPTVADIGGRIRVSAEIVDPHTQTTVYAEAADGVGLASSLSSMDVVTGRLRLSLGETLQAISHDTQPLPKVTSGSIDALRAYGAGVSAQGRGDFEAAAVAYRKAIALEPEFALARLGLARVAMSRNDRSEARGHITEALRLRDRLTSRDALYLDAWNASLESSPGAALAKWKLLADMYPDFFAGSFNHGLFLAMYPNRFEEAIAAVQPALAEQNPLRAGVHYTLGWLHTGMEQFEDADRHFARSRDLGNEVAGNYHALSLLARGRHADAAAVLDAVIAAGSPAEATAPARALIALDRGDLAAFSRASEVAEREEETLDPALASGVRAGRLAVQVVAGAAGPDVLAAPIEDAARLLAQPGQAHHDQALFGALLAGYAASRAGAPALAEQALALAEDSTLPSDNPNLAAMQRSTRAEWLRATGKPAAALEQLGTRAAAHDLYQLRSARMRAARAAGDLSTALREADWLADSRGRAVAEWGMNFSQSPLNLLDSSLALLEAAEVQLEAGRRDEAAALLAELRARWTAPAGPLTRRVAALEAGLSLE